MAENTNVILIAIDTLRADHLGCYGYPRKTSPTLDVLAEEGVLFENHISTCAHTTPAFTSIFTGQHPFHFGIVGTLSLVVNNKEMNLNELLPTLPEVLWRNGYETVGFDNLFSFRGRPKWHARGFKYYVDLTNSVKTPDFPHYLPAGPLNDELIPFLEKMVNPERKNFLFVHYWEPHLIYNLPNEYRGVFPRSLEDLDTAKTPDGEDYLVGAGKKKILDYDGSLREDICLYDEEIKYLDIKLKELFNIIKKIGLYDNSLIIIVGDHGEGLGEHNCYNHRHPYEGTIRVPLIIKPPKDFQIKNHKVNAMSSHMDIMPTILDWTETPHYLGFHGNPALPGQLEADPKKLTAIQSEAEMVERDWGGGIYTHYPYLDFDGVSLLPLIQGKKSSVRSSVISSGCCFLHNNVYKAVEVSLRKEKYKLIIRSPIPPGNWEYEAIQILVPRRTQPRWTTGFQTFNELPRMEFLNFRDDPFELQNLVDQKKDIIDEFMTELEPVLKTPLFYGP